MDLGDRGGRQRGPLEAGEQLVHPGAELSPDYLVDRGPGHGGHVVLQRAQFGDELLGQQVAAGAQHLAELDEGHTAVFECQPDRVGEAGAAIGRAKLRPASAPQVRQKAATRENSAYMRIASAAA